MKERISQKNVWRSCSLEEAEQYRYREDVNMPGSIGLQKNWSEWQNGKPFPRDIRLEYEYRKKTGGE